MDGESQAIQKCPPRTLAGDPANTTVVALVAATTSLAQVLWTPTTNGQQSGSFWVTMICTADMFVRFGQGDPGAAVAATDYLIPAFQEREFWVKFETQFRAISTVGGTLYWYRSSR